MAQKKEQAMLEINKKCVVLARVSSRAQEEEGYSLDAQEHLSKEYCSTKSMKASKVFRITETASKTQQRKLFGEMMKYLIKNKINVLVVEKVDRLTRSFKDMVMIDDWLEGDEKREVHLIKDSLVMNKNSRSQDKLNWGVKVLFAKNYTDNLREEVFKGRKEKLTQGWLPGKPPFGYITIGDKGKKTHIPHADNSKLVRMLFQQYLNPSESLSSLTLYAESIGIRTSKGKPMSRSAITDNILKNPFYIGINRWEGIDYPGEQIPIIDEDLFKQVQARMHRKSPPKYRRHDPDLRSVIRCSDCNGTITWEFQKEVWYGHCNRYKGCPKKEYVKQDEVEKQLFEHFEKLLCPSSEIAKWIIESLKVKHQNDIYDYSASVETLRREFDRKKRHMDLLYEDRLNERISTDKYDELSKAIIQETKDIESNIAKVSDNSRKQLSKGIEVLEKSQKAIEIYRNKPASEKRLLLSELFTELHLDGKKLSVTYNPYTLAISKRAEMHGNLLKDFRTKQKTSANRGNLSSQTESEFSVSIWRAIESDFRTVAV